MLLVCYDVFWRVLNVAEEEEKLDEEEKEEKLSMLLNDSTRDSIRISRDGGKAFDTSPKAAESGAYDLQSQIVSFTKDLSNFHHELVEICKFVPTITPENGAAILVILSKFQSEIQTLNEEVKKIRSGQAKFLPPFSQGDEFFGDIYQPQFGDNSVPEFCSTNDSSTVDATQASFQCVPAFLQSPCDPGIEFANGAT